ncbi:hypothetical protein EC973_006011 [Apophysomyces ossiformis]|uniref:Uncharacterized protein n=1 Tax=Apophysomyces ossiformis TaxID=679940 RepID=A0A8H7BEK1_9FUNG|nr:hypothetical protein EC973_006011 [Apophysomyces ossiformis]
MLTLGQAACLVLGDPPTIENRKEAKEYFAKSRLAVTYIRNHDPYAPIAVGKALVERDPFKYQTYPDTPHLSPTIGSPISIEEIKPIAASGSERQREVDEEEGSEGVSEEESEPVLIGEYD